MPVPDFQAFFSPILRTVHDGAEYSSVQLRKNLASEMNLKDEDLNELLLSGKQSTFSNRVTWATVYLVKAGLLQRPRRGVFKITERGRKVLADNPTPIRVDTLNQFPEFLEFHQRGIDDREPDDCKKFETETPEERLANSYQVLRESLAAELLETVKKCTPAFFERLVVDLLVAMGYGGSRQDAGKAVGGSGDGGIDGIIKEDRLGLDAVYIQAKRWSGSVGRPVVQAFAGSLEGLRARKGVLITTSAFSSDALDYVQRIEKKIVLIDGKELALLMIDFGVGVNTVVTYTVKRIDQDYFEES